MTESTTGTSRTAQSALPRDWQDWIRANLRSVGIGAGAVLVVAAVVLGFLATAKRKAAAADQALAQAWATVEAGNMPLAANDLNRLVERFSGTRAADEATILLGEIRLLNGETEAAVRSLQDFLRKGRESYFEASALALLGGGLENQGKAREAAAAYRRASEAAELPFLKAQYLLDAGRAFSAAGDTASAKAAYGEVLSRFGELNQAAEARVRMGEVGGEVPPAPRRRTVDGGPQAG